MEERKDMSYIVGLEEGAGRDGPWVQVALVRLSDYIDVNECYYDEDHNPDAEDNLLELLFTYDYHVIDGGTSGWHRVNFLVDQTCFACGGKGEYLPDGETCPQPCPKCTEIGICPHCSRFLKEDGYKHCLNTGFVTCAFCKTKIDRYL
jgi:hypothetical protein